MNVPRMRRKTLVNGRTRESFIVVPEANTASGHKANKQTRGRIFCGRNDTNTTL